ANTLSNMRTRFSSAHTLNTMFHNKRFLSHPLHDYGFATIVLSGSVPGQTQSSSDVQAPSLGSLSSSSESIAFPFLARGMQHNRQSEQYKQYKLREQHKKPSSNWRTRAEFTLCSSSLSWYHHHLSHSGTSAGSFQYIMSSKLEETVALQRARPETS
ncbi:MAG: hypothetical protein ABI406_03685, partial [Ktedonobacteraceae bacterium]